MSLAELSRFLVNAPLSLFHSLKFHDGN